MDQTLSLEDAIKIASQYIQTVIKKSANITQKQQIMFHNKLKDLLMRKYNGHWYPDIPLKGHGYRSLNFNVDGYMDPIIKEAAEYANIGGLAAMKGPKFYLWIDPDEVCIKMDTEGADKEVLLPVKEDGKTSGSVITNTETGRITQLDTRKTTPLSSSTAPIVITKSYYSYTPIAYVSPVLYHEYCYYFNSSVQGHVSFVYLLRYNTF